MERKVLTYKEIDKSILKSLPNPTDKAYEIKIKIPEFTFLGVQNQPDFADVYITFYPKNKIIELKALKLYINSFMNRHVSHENSANEIFDTLYEKLQPKWMKVIADFKPRGNVHTVIEIDSDKM